MKGTAWRVLDPRGVAAVVGLVGVLAVAAGCGPEPEQEVRAPDPTPSTGSGVDLADADLWLSFEKDRLAYDGSREFPDVRGAGLTGRVVTANGGEVEVVAGADGSTGAAAFPTACTAAVGCPRAMVEIAPDPVLDAGTGDFEYGAGVRLAPDQMSVGSNIVQKGRFGTEGGQWKLQVDNKAGEPSCVVRSGADVLVVRSATSVADGAWHRVTCRRDAEGLSIRVDGEVERREGPTGSVDNPWPVRIGSPGVGEQDDQFHGSIDDVFLRIDP